VQTGHAVFTSGAPIEAALDRALRRRGLVPLVSAAVAVT